MRSCVTIFFLIVTAPLFSQTGNISNAAISPLASYSNVWNDIKYSTCNTAVNTPWLTKDEKEVIYILNLVRAQPALFVKTVLKKYPAVSGQGYLADDQYYFISLVKTLEKMAPLNILYPDKACFESAQCHAYNSGITGYIGHERKTKDCKTKKHFYGECADYGHSDPLDIVLSLLIDEGIPSLGHRLVCLSSYDKIGISIQPHSRYGRNAVLDFYY
ncbi:MAG: hypothetical protein ABIN74_04285 [Ferruginibacter sp.]